MKRFATFFGVLYITMSGFAQQLAPLGKLLDPYYTQMPAEVKAPVWVYFKDKGPAADQRLSAAPETYLSQRAISRRQRALQSESVISMEDVPLEQSYVAQVGTLVSQVRYEMKWFNCMSVTATKAQIEQLRRLPFVKEIDLVAGFKAKRYAQDQSVLDKQPSPPVPAATPVLNYGASLTQNQQINVVAVHNLGINGSGVLIGMFDDAFPNISVHPALMTRPIVARYDFIDNSPILSTNDSHGQETFSTIGGYSEGNLIGPAYGASFVLSRTEDANSEKPVEEDAWARAAIWADSIGIDVSSTSLGYDAFDSPWPGYTWQNMNGQTTVITRAADRAAALGICVVNAAGNNGDAQPPNNSLGAPADGFNVITAGAVGSSGSRVSFSSVGPTVDGRIKPDIMAMGSGVTVASGSSGYSSVSGTSFSCPLSAGVAALVLSANPGLTPFQVREAMRQTASRVSTPDRLYGWGILNALNAVNYAWITHTPLSNTEDTTARVIRLKIHSRSTIVTDSTRLYYGINGSFTNSVALTPFGSPENYTATIPYLGSGVTVTYYLAAKNANVSTRLPLGTQYFSYQVGPDATGPTITHTPLGNASIASWPPRISAIIKDQSGVSSARIEYSKNGAAQTPIALTSSDSTFSDTLRISRSQVHNGDTIAYRIVAADGSRLGNTSMYPASGYISFAVKNYANVASDFEADNASFTGTNDWQYGTPGSTSPQPHSGSKLWATILSGNYTQGPKLSTLTTPAFTVFSNRASFSFYHWYENESRFDGGNVKISINGGPFQLLRPVGGYPNDTIYAGFANPLGGQPGYANTSGSTWSKATFDLTGIAAEGNTIALRFDFGSDNDQYQYRGWYIDDFASNGFGTLITTDVQSGFAVPAAFRLEQNYPNPFNPATTIRFQTPNKAHVALKVYDILGRDVATLVNEVMEAGNHQAVFNAAGFASGTYFYKLQSGNNVSVRKLILMK